MCRGKSGGVACLGLAQGARFGVVGWPGQTWELDQTPGTKGNLQANYYLVSFSGLLLGLWLCLHVSHQGLPAGSKAAMSCSAGFTPRPRDYRLTHDRTHGIQVTKDHYKGEELRGFYSKSNKGKTKKSLTRLLI